MAQWDNHNGAAGIDYAFLDRDCSISWELLHRRWKSIFLRSVSSFTEVKLNFDSHEIVEPLKRFRFRYGKKFLFLVQENVILKRRRQERTIRFLDRVSLLASLLRVQRSFGFSSKQEESESKYKPCSFVIADQLGSICMMYHQWDGNRCNAR